MKLVQSPYFYRILFPLIDKTLPNLLALNIVIWPEINDTLASSLCNGNYFKYFKIIGSEFVTKKDFLKLLRL